MPSQPRPVWQQRPISRPWTRLADPAVRQRLADLGQDFLPVEEQTPAALGALQKAEIEKWCRSSRRLE